jgi:hypothetical protein
MPNPIFQIEMLPAKQGDALWIEYGEPNALHRVMIDGGPIGAFPEIENKLSHLPEQEKDLDLLVITHVDTDHIDGIIRLLAPKWTDWLIRPAVIWFNGWKHMEDSQILGGLEGDYLSALIVRRVPDIWNKNMDQQGSIVVDPHKPLQTITLDGGMEITLLSPNPAKLKQMADHWRQDVEQNGIHPGDLDEAWKQLIEKTKFNVDKGILGSGTDIGEKLIKQLKVDPSAANGSSIAFLAKYSGKSCLFLGDAHMDIVCDSIKKLIPNGQSQLSVTAVKMAHHGSRNNITKEFIQLVQAPYYLISTNGVQQHPNKFTVDAVMKWADPKPTLCFNYPSALNAVRKRNPDLIFSSLSPKKGEEGYKIKL